MSTALKDGRVDAVAMWEPEAERAIAAVGSDAIVFQDRRVYRELFNLNTSTKVLADPGKKRAIVELLRPRRRTCCGVLMSSVIGEGGRCE